MKAIKKEFWTEIRKSKARFISILFIVALGVAFFSGIQAASPDMRFSGDAYYDSAKLMDIKVMGTMGLTEDDVEAIRAVDGVEDAEGAWSTDVMSGEGELQKVLHIEAVNQKVNKLTAAEGRLPKKSGEIFLDSAYAGNEGYEIGDTVNLYEDKDSHLLKRKKYTVVGVGSSPLYISFNRGNTTLGSGEINGFAYIVPEDFDQEVYTQIYIQVHGAEGLTSYTDGYDNLIDKIRKRVEGIEEVRCQARYDGVVSEAREKLDDARKELEDGKKEADEKLADAKKELEDGEKKLKDSQKEYDDGVKKLADAKQEVKDGKKEIENAKKEVEDGKNQLSSAKRELSDGWTQLHAAKRTLDSGKAELNAAKQELASGWEEVNANQKKLDKGKAELASAKKEVEAGRQEIANANLSQVQDELESRKQQCMDGLAEVEAGESQLPAAEAAIEEARGQVAALFAQASELQAQYDAAAASGEASEEELAALQEQLAALTQAADAAQSQLEEKEGELAANRQRLAAMRTELENGLASVEQGLIQLEEKKAELEAAEKKLDAAQKEINKQEKTIAASQTKIDEAKKKLVSGQAEIDKNEKKLASGQAEINANIARLNSGQAEIDQNEKKLADGEREIQENEKKIADGEKEIKDNEKKLADGKKELEDGRKELEDGRKEYEDAKKDAQKEIADGEKKLEDAQKELDDLKMPEWIVTDRGDLPEYADYGDNADRIRNIGRVFPVIFFLVAALISLTTMTRMVEEQRTQIGTMKSLGYGKFAIASKYLNYALLATIGGSVLGILIGEKILPYIIINAYGIMYHNMAASLQIDYELRYALIASAAAVVCTVGATVFSSIRALTETPASLMRPPAPKEGKRVLVERITFLWKHLSFSWKSTLRNLFRYKKRLFMTIFGIAGSMALMLVGYGIKDSVMDIAGLQFEQIQHYDATVIMDEDATPQEKEELEEQLAGNEKVQRSTLVQLSKMTAPRDKSNLSVYVFVPQDRDAFGEDVTLRDRKTKKSYELTDAGAVICEKTASLMGIKVGDTIPLKKDNKTYEAPVAVITENYMSHYVYMTEAVYELTFGEKPDYENITFTLKEEYRDQLTEIGNSILKYPAALSISYTSSIAGQLERMLSALETVIVVLIISAGMLAFVVLYNLNNINITERQRELATLKVLGFYDGEVSQYVFRENVLLTFIGVAAGAIFGIFLHRYVIVTVEVDAVMFGRIIKPASFLYSALFTWGFSMIVNGAMHFKLKKINMVESLKSVE